MRGIGWSLGLLIAAGCTSGDVTFEHRSSLETRARGVGLHDTGDSAQVGMAGNTCEVDTANGMIGNDYDVAVAEDDQVQDTMGTETIIIGQSGAGVFTLDRDQWFENTGSPTISVDQVTGARFQNGGIVVMRDQASQCTVEWYQGDDLVGSTGVPGATCDAGSFTVDRATGTAYVPVDGGIAIATPDGAQTVDTAADIAAWDATANVLYVARKGDSLVTGLEASGTVRFATDVGGPISAIDDMGDVGAAAVMVGDAQTGAIVTVDGYTGEIRSDFATPSTADEIVVNADATVMAVVLEDEVHFYSVNLLE